jgi:hypothetical protein
MFPTRCIYAHRHRHAPADQIGDERGQAVDLTLRVAIFDCDVAAFNVADLAQPAPERLGQLCRIVGGGRSDEPDHRHCRLLRVRRERPRNSRAAEQRDELMSDRGLSSTRSLQRTLGVPWDGGANCSYIEVASPAFAYALTSQG